MNLLKKRTNLCLAVCFLLCLCTGCRADKQKDPITLTIWHVYGGQTDSPLNDMIDVYNQTEGKVNGIYVQVTSVTNTNTIHEGVLAAANHDPGAASLPDMFVSYPKTVLALPDTDILVDYGDYLSEEEKEAYLPEFLAEGVIEGKQLLFPVAKSTEILFVNKTAFDRFATETGASLSVLETWEGLYETAKQYTKWTDAQTPEVLEDGKPFFVHDYHFNYFQVGTASLGEDFFDGEKIAFGPAFAYAWKPYAGAAILGGVWLENGYATEALRTGDAIVSVASSASILYYSDVVTHPDNNSERIEIIARPCPVFEGGEKLVMQRGAGICTVKSNKEKEKAACHFLKWLTQPDHNVAFVTQTGYMPVTKEAFENYLPKAIENLEDPKYRELYQAFVKTQQEYEFYTPPQLESYLDLETEFEAQVRLLLQAGRNAFLEQKQAEKEEQSTRQDTGETVAKQQKTEAAAAASDEETQMLDAEIESALRSLKERQGKR